MQPSIRDASRFVVGTSLLREQAMQNDPKHAQMLTFENVATAVLQLTEDGAKLRNTVEVLADNEGEWFRSNPPHAMNSERVINSRRAEINALRSINGAALSTLTLGLPAIKKIGNAAEQLTDVYSSTYTAIDAAPGSANERRAMVSLLHEQAQRLSPDPKAIRNILNHAEKQCLAAQAEAILSRYEKPLDRSNDFDI